MYYYFLTDGFLVQTSCPMCRKSFTCITKLDNAASSDQKAYSQSVPNDSLKTKVYVLPDEMHPHPANVSEFELSFSF